VVLVQNAVALHQLGIATGTMNFFRALGSAFMVSGFAAIVLAGGPMVRGVSADAVLAGAEAAQNFRLGFPAPIPCPMGDLASILMLEERPLRGSAQGTKQSE